MSIDQLLAISDRMGVQLVISLVALKHLKAMPKADAKRLLEALQAIAAAHPERMPYVTELVGQANVWRARKGDYRAVYAIGGDIMTIIAVGHRKDIYK